jgi:pilus assembly protein CpaC
MIQDFLLKIQNLLQGKWQAMSVFFFSILCFSVPSISAEMIGDYDVNDIGSTEKQPLNILLGDASIVNLSQRASEILISQEGIVQTVLRTAQQIVFIGKSIGTTKALFFNQDGRQFLSLDVRVEYDVGVLLSAIHRHFPRSDVFIESVIGKLILTGEVRSAEEAYAITGFTENYVSAIGNGSAKEEKSQIVNRLIILEEDQVMIRVRVAEVKRGLTKRLGFQWDKNSFGMSVGELGTKVTGSLLNGSGISSIVAALGNNGSAVDKTKNLGFTLQALENNNLMHTLAEPSLTAISGESASFHAGGEHPIPSSVNTDTSGNTTISYSFKPIGISLEFSPKVLSEGRINLKISTEVSELSSENGATQNGVFVKGTVKRKANTTVELPSGGTIILAGLLQNTTDQTVNSVPGLGSLPIIGSLFRNTELTNRQTELVILATPYIVRPGHLNDFSMPTDGFGVPGDFDRYLFGKLSTRYGGNYKNSKTFSQNVAAYQGSEGESSTTPVSGIPVGFIME